MLVVISQLPEGDAALVGAVSERFADTVAVFVSCVSQDLTCSRLPLWPPLSCAFCANVTKGPAVQAVAIPC